MSHLSSLASRLGLHCLLATAAAVALGIPQLLRAQEKLLPDPIVGGWRIEGGNLEITVTPEGKLDSTKFTGTWKKAPGQPQGYLFQWKNAPEQLLTLDAAGKSLTGSNDAGRKVQLTRTRMGSLGGAEYAGMTLGQDWIAQRTEGRKEFMTELRAITTATIGKAERGKEPAPEQIWGPIKWLMPLDDAKKHLPSGVGQGSEETVATNCFPKDSLKLVKFTGKWTDGYLIQGFGQGARISASTQSLVFDTLYLMIDVKRKVVGLQLTDRNVKIIPQPSTFPEMLVTELGGGTYFDYLHMTYPGGQRIVLDTSPAKPGRQSCAVLLGGKGAVHWYLPAPLAGRILDTIDYIEKK